MRSPAPKFLAATAFALGLAFAVAPGARAAAPAVGTWLSANGGTKVRITECSGNKLCGKVVWVQKAIDPTTGRPKTDKHNANPSKRDRPLIGVPVVQGMAPDGPNKWSGQIYNADDGKTYQAHVTVVSNSAMNVQGCVLGFLCKSQTWTRTE